MRSKIILLWIFLIGFILSISSVSAANITGEYKYAWGTNIGYVNFENTTVSDSSISGYAWSKNHGWIRFDAQNGGVSNNNGDLSGYAWGEQLGWINFNNVSINVSSGKFSGTATGDIIGTLNFDCPNFCDVRTNWRPTSTTQGTGGGGGSNPTPPTIPMTPAAPTAPTTPTTPIVPTSPTIPITQTPDNPTNPPSPENKSQSTGDDIKRFFDDLQIQLPTDIAENDYQNSYNAPLTVEPRQKGLLVWDFTTLDMIEESKRRAVIIELPEGISMDTVTISVKISSVSSVVQSNQISLLGTVFDVIATDKQGQEIHQLDKPIKITLIIPENLRGRNDLGVYSLTNGDNNWTRISEVVFDDTSATFQVDHFTHFAVFAANNIIETMPIASSASQSDAWSYGILIVSLLMLLLIYKSRKKKVSKKHQI